MRLGSSSAAAAAPSSVWFACIMHCLLLPMRKHLTSWLLPPCLAAPQFYKDGAALPATVIALEAGNIVTQVKTADKDGYAAVQVRTLRCMPCLQPC